VTASYGVNGFTTDHKRAFAQHGTERVYIAYDRDEAGDSAADQLSKELMEMGIECFRVLFPKGMDANEYARKVQPAAKSLGVLLNKAEWLGKGERPAPIAESIAAELEAAAKEEMMEEESPAEIVAESSAVVPGGEVIEPEPIAEEPSNNVLSLAAEPEPVTPIEAAVPPVIDVPVEVRGEDIFLQQGNRR
jgi:hypothetical protein